MGKVYFIATLALVQAFVLLSGQANAQTTVSPSVAGTVSPSVAGTVSPSVAGTVSQSTAATVSQSTAATVSQSTAATVSESTAATVSESTTGTASQSTAATVSQSTAATVSQSTAATVTQTTAATASQSTAATVSESTTGTVSQSTAATASQSTAATVSQRTATPASQSTAATASQSTAATASQSTAATVTQSTAATASQSTAATVSQSTATPASQSTGAAPSQSTPASPPSSSVALPTPGSVVIICLLVKVPYCNAGLHGNTSSSQSQALLANITTNMKSTYSAAQVTVISAYLTSSSCGSNNYVALYIKVTFKLGIPTNRFIETILKDEIKDKYLGNLPVSDTQYNVTFEGVTLGYNIKDGECQKVCCVAGGPVVMVETCTPKDNKYKCEGFLAKTREELKHCHGETNDLCSSTPCTTATPDKACSSHSPSLALLLLLTIASFLKLTAC